MTAKRAITEPEQMAVCMGLDAMRLCMGIPTRNFTHAEVLRWMDVMKQAGGRNPMSPAALTTTQEKKG